MLTLSEQQKILEQAKKTLEIESQSVIALKKNLDASFLEAVELVLGCSGHLIVTGIGKSAIIGQKIAATFNSTGTASLFIHAADALHGDLGMVKKEDILLVLSKSGDTAEIKNLLPVFKRLKIPVIAFVGSLESILSKSADCVIHLPIEREADPNRLAPSSSTIVQLAMGDALAFSVQTMKDFSASDFADLHPSGILGKQLNLRLSDLYINNGKPAVQLNSGIEEIVLEMTSKRLGVTAVLEGEKLRGIITDGDLRRALTQNLEFKDIVAGQIMGKSPKTLLLDTMASDALILMKKNSITQILVTNTLGDYVGVVHLHDLIKEGLA